MGRDLAASLLAPAEPHLVAMPVPDRAALARGFSYADGRPCTLLAQSGQQTEAATERGALFGVVMATAAAERARVLEGEIARRVCAVLGLAGPVRGDVPFRQLGMDSLMAVMVRNALATALGRKLPATILFDHPTVERLSRELVRALEEGSPRGVPREPVAPTTVDDLQLLASLSAGLVNDIFSELPPVEPVDERVPQ
jgi:hypothetical protein